ncbi:hypothetical protein Pla123a_48090 [Posidoniimonas polymericola]|uniref:Uncharacterized protein n=1 Tax=Posidoniimonas polymericola TaxID=2528002 RepID=A0A5C5XT96_9BACT|nr:hypothetical protein [Posidoniimonas polymericola]TWT65898.1 hypothetical protein Pla123a_48090 [Posidoniimonas polymericola]
MQPKTVQQTDIIALADNEASPCVSLYMPTHRAGRETQQDPIRLKNLLKEADEQLAKRGLDHDKRQQLLAPLAELPDNADTDFWRYSTDGLAVLLNSDGAQAFRLHGPTPEFVLAAEQYFLNPLLRSLQSDGRFYLLAVSQNKVRLFEGDSRQLSEIETDLLPDDLRDALNIDEYQSALQYHSTAQAGASGGDPVYHGHGGGEGEDQKKELLQFFHRLATPLSKVLAGEQTGSPTPLLFAGVGYLFPIFREACDYRGLLDEPLTRNPDEASADELHDPAWEIVRPHYATRWSELSEKYGLAASRDLATDDLSAICKHAEQGRLQTLVFSEAAMQHHETASEERSAELAHAGVETLRTGGDVLVCSPDNMPVKGDVAAICRF